MKYNKFFSKTYKEARIKVLKKINENNLFLKSYENLNLGIEGEKLFIDFCFINPNQKKIILITSGCHGIEGYAGSAFQLYILENLKEIIPILEKNNITIILGHALNPWGFSWGRRVTEEGVDLNRNFIDWNKELPKNYQYTELHEHFVPWVWPYSYADQQLQNFSSKFGFKKMQDIMTVGQYEYPTGLCYGGKEPTWASLQIKNFLESIYYFSDLLWIDIHTGVGSPGNAEILYGWDDDKIKNECSLIFQDLKILNIGENNSSTSKINGSMIKYFLNYFNNKKYIGLLYEIGTISSSFTGGALRAEQTIWNHKTQKDLLWQHHARPHLRLAMYPESTLWYNKIFDQWQKVFSKLINNF